MKGRDGLMEGRLKVSEEKDGQMHIHIHVRTLCMKEVCSTYT